MDGSAIHDMSTVLFVSLRCSCSYCQDNQWAFGRQPTGVVELDIAILLKVFAIPCCWRTSQSAPVSWRTL